MARYIDKSFDIWRFGIMIHVVDLFVDTRNNGTIYPLTRLDLIKIHKSFGLSFTLPVLKISIYYRSR